MLQASRTRCREDRTSAGYCLLDDERQCEQLRDDDEAPPRGAGGAQRGAGHAIEQTRFHVGAPAFRWTTELLRSVFAGITLRYGASRRARVRIRACSPRRGY